MSLKFDKPESRHLGRILLTHAERNPDGLYLMADEQRLSFGATNQLANRFASGLRELGVGRGDRIAIYMKPSLHFVVLTLAANKLGAVWTPVNTDYKGSWLSEALTDSKPTVVITDAALLSNVLSAEANTPRNYRLLCDFGDTPPARQTDIVALSDFFTLADGEPDMSAIRYGDTAAILWTSGTTGKPKGVMQSHNAWIRSSESGIRTSDIRSDSITYTCLPFYNSAAWVTAVFPALVAGIPCGLDQQFSVTNFWDRIRHYGATHTLTLGAMHMFLWNAPERDDDADNPLRIAYMVPMPETIQEPFCRRFGMEKVVQGYGQSEIMALIVRGNSSTKQWKPNALGEPLNDLILELHDDDGNATAPGEPGEFCVKPLAPHVIFNGYFDQPELTGKAFDGEWYRTGDLGVRDSEGNFFFVDRKKDVIRYKGRNISSLQVEHMAQRHPAVAAAAAFGIPSAELEFEHEIKLDVILKSGHTLDAAELARFINDNAPYFMVPRYIEFVTSLPYTPTNKIEKYKLRSRGLNDATWDRDKNNFEVKR